MAPLGARLAGGSTPALDGFGVDSEHGRMRDVLLGDPATFRWLGIENATYSALVRDTLRRGHRFDRERALAQHGEMVGAFRDAGVAVHLLDAREELAYGVYTRDSSVMTPWGAIVCQLANPRRRGEYASCLDFYAGAGIPVYDMVTAATSRAATSRSSRPAPRSSATRASAARRSAPARWAAGSRPRAGTSATRPSMSSTSIST